MNIAVFCSSSNDLNQSYHEQAELLGNFIGEKGHSLVYGGSHNGLMLTVANAAKRKEAFVIGILPEDMQDQASAFIDEKLIVDSLSERKLMIQEYADIFVILPGGFGTLDELFEVLATAQVGEHDKKLIIVNIDGFYDPMVDMFNRIFEQKFSAEANKEHYFIVITAQECIVKLNELAV